MDRVTQNANVHVTMYPVPWISLCLQYHRLWLARAEDALYYAGDAAIRRSGGGAAGSSVGDDRAAVLNVHVDTNSDVLVAYACLIGRRFLEETAGPGASSTRALYLIYNVR